MGTTKCTEMRLKKLLAALYIIIILTMAVATVVEKYQGTAFTQANIYGSWWFCLLWALLVAAGIAYIIKRRMRRWNIVLLHLSLIVILAGALLTHLTSFKGAMHLRVGEATNEYLESGTDMEQMKPKKLPFTLKLKKFNVIYHNGTDAPADYVSALSVIDDGKEQAATVSMNNILTHRGVRFYQSSYDQDGQGSVLAINSDPFGIPVTYTGYALLFFSLIWLLIDPRGTFRRLLRSETLRKGVLTVAIIISSAAVSHVSATTTLPHETAKHFGEMFTMYNGRVCQLQTYAYDFTKKLCGHRSYKGCSPEQVVAGFVFWGDEWSREKIIKVKGGALKNALQLPDYVSLNDLFIGGDYRLRTYVEEYYGQDQHDGFHKQAAEIDDKVALIMELRMGQPLRIFPLTANGTTTWVSPMQQLPKGAAAKDTLFMRGIYGAMYHEALAGNNQHVNLMINHIMAYQQKHAAGSLPTKTQVWAERVYNAIPFATILFMVNLTLGFVALFIAIYSMTRDRKKPARWQRTINVALIAILTLSLATLLFALALRWIVSGNVPMSNGYETMLVVAWFVMLLSLIAYRKAHIVLVFGFLLSGFFLLVSHIGQMNPAIGQMMPVLNSPLLSVHVSIIMMSYALLSLTFICAVTSIILSITNHNRSTLIEQQSALMTLSRIFLYPGITTLGIGIFIGAIWANVSWGTYWSWDPKETWALITLMIYAVPLHISSIPRLQKPQAYHLYMLLAFLSIIITYFGVNYLLSGMHSYA